MVENQQTDQGVVMTLRPNRSATWAQNKLLLLAFGAIIFIIAIGWTIVGAWLVLPFAGIEFLLLAFLTYKICYQNYQADVITIDQYRVTIQLAVGQKPTQIVLVRPDTYLYTRQPTRPLDPISLRLADNNQTVKIGTFLNKEDRKLCCLQLKQAGFIELSDRWWTS